MQCGADSIVNDKLGSFNNDTGRMECGFVACCVERIE